MKTAALKYDPIFPIDTKFSIYYHDLEQIKKETANLGKYSWQYCQLCVFPKKHTNEQNEHTQGLNSSLFPSY